VCAPRKGGNNTLRGSVPHVLFAVCVCVCACECRVCVLKQALPAIGPSLPVRDDRRAVPDRAQVAVAVHAPPAVLQELLGAPTPPSLLGGKAARGDRDGRERRRQRRQQQQGSDGDGNAVSGGFPRSRHTLLPPHLPHHQHLPAVDGGSGGEDGGRKQRHRATAARGSHVPLSVSLPAVVVGGGGAGGGGGRLLPAALPLLGGGPAGATPGAFVSALPPPLFGARHSVGHAVAAAYVSPYAQRAMPPAVRPIWR
jgi:hypothetical protein